MKKRILFFGEGVTLAHIVRPLALARTVDLERFDVHFACSRSYAHLIDPEFTHHHIESTSPEEFAEILNSGNELFPAKRLQSYAEQDLACFRDVNPDVVVGDLRLSLSVSAAFAGLPYISISSGCWSPWRQDLRIPLPTIKPFSTIARYLGRSRISMGFLEDCFQLLVPGIFRQQGRGLDELRSSFGLQPFGNYLEGFTHSDLTLYADTPSVAPTVGLPRNHRYVGPLMWSPDVAMPDCWDEVSNEKTLVFVNLGSSGDPGAFETVLKVLARMDVHVLVAKAGREGIDCLGSNVWVEDFVPGERVGERADVVVTNGGSPSSYQALSTGTPVLGIASNMDQVLTMRNIERSGAGLMLRNDSLSEAAVKAALGSLITLPRFQRCADAVAREFTRWDTAEIFESAIDEVMKVSLHPTAFEHKKRGEQNV
jgi:UDP:flavonoid glycosyltransferase YjiC (YdhE family)